MSQPNETAYPRMVVEQRGHFSWVFTERSPWDRVQHLPRLPEDYRSGDSLLIMYTDASVQRPQFGGHAASSVVWHDGVQWNGRSRIEPPARHAEALQSGLDFRGPSHAVTDATEMAGIAMALQIAAQLTWRTPQAFDCSMLLIWTDSQHCVDRIHHLMNDRWIRPLLGMPIDMLPPFAGARRTPGPIAGEDEAVRLIRGFASLGIVVDVNWLRGHSRALRLGNVFADHLAVVTTVDQRFRGRPIGSRLSWDLLPSGIWSFNQDTADAYSTWL